uniref:Uncharacterized protein n=1 Tax=Romanomermis culicivorax TaxID=13658 RepID=A0A915I708_ROMCU
MVTPTPTLANGDPPSSGHKTKTTGPKVGEPKIQSVFQHEIKASEQKRYASGPTPRIKPYILVC